MISAGYGERRLMAGGQQWMSGGHIARISTPAAAWQDCPVAVGIAPAGVGDVSGPSSGVLDARALRGEGADRLVLVVFGLLAGLALWSFSYLVRQPGLAMAEPPSLIGNFAVEGMLLALAWLAAFSGGALAVATGVVTFQEPGR